MTTTDWTQVDDGFRRDSYEITPVAPYAGRGWLLRTVAGVRRFVASGPAGLQYQTLHSAKNFASHYELESVRRVKQLRHGLLGGVALTIGTALLWFATSILEVDATPMSILAMTFLLIGVREAIYFQAAISRGTEYFYRRHELGMVDRVVGNFAFTVVRGRRRTHQEPEELANVTIVPIDMRDFTYPSD